MKNIIYFLTVIALLYGCGEKDNRSVPDKLEFVYNQAYMGVARCPDSVSSTISMAFGKDYTYFYIIYANLGTRLQTLKGRYSLQELDNGRFNILLSDTADLGFGYADIQMRTEKVDNLSEIFPVEYSLTMTLTPRMHGDYLQVNLINVDTTQGYSIHADHFGTVRSQNVVTDRRPVE